jgi:NAD(P)H-hydrate repair Nnr-like enzyme with NAD(P)H-hydrate dehydratase domain
MNKYLFTFLLCTVTVSPICGMQQNETTRTNIIALLIRTNPTIADADGIHAYYSSESENTYILLTTKSHCYKKLCMGKNGVVTSSDPIDIKQYLDLKVIWDIQVVYGFLKKLQLDA